ncbi:MAG: hypothetical protein ACT6QT_06495 [Sphingopyxis sp.]|jgi:hypothetical protein|uniref:hypothetical protein n=1 Tax=unclassified Sphingopyxis TaxID=2614943 RepID=UPI0028548BEC|nr:MULTISPECIES: hypothetical protein [unclassified Sphingopyxis]MDR7061134.1 hypothetical protein [Sphingopyxis sp. BE235]MDR7181591.1 hypothetical protein [Sphingopyxis sp. BE249]
MNLSRKIIVAGLLASVAACAPKPPPPPPPPPPPVAVVIPPRPMPPGNAAVTQILPGRGIDGRFVTANSGVTGDRAFWQLKIGLNVAAIGCRGLEETTLISAYNNIIKTHGKVIKSTEKSVITQLGKENKNNGIAPRDRLSTQLFNYFAQPPAQRGFCARANEIAQVVSSTPTAQLVEQAPAHLARLDEPFNEFYQAYAQYQVDAVAWDAKYAPRPAIMNTPAPVSPVGPTASVTVPPGNH